MRRSKREVRRKTRSRSVRRPYQPVANDNLTRAFTDVGAIPDEFKSSDEFLDVITWNIRFFHDKDAARVERITEILATLNADLMVFQEILGGSMEAVANGLVARGAGHYTTAYGTTGGQQRVAMMWDVDWVRAKDDVREIFERGQYVSPTGKDAFPRLPLWGAFTSVPAPGLDSQPFDLQILGLHLKSQRGGGEDQRRIAADALALWLRKDAVHVDADVVMLGDWNQPPDAAAWQAFRDLEDDDLALFQSINNSEDISHLYYKNKSELGSRLDLASISIAASKQMKDPPKIIRWTSLDDLLASQPNAAEIKEFIKQVSDNVSDHMPVVMRFYFEERPLVS